VGYVGTACGFQLLAVPFLFITSPVEKALLLRLRDPSMGKFFWASEMVEANLVLSPAPLA